jgi:hypothetical protein
MAKLRVGTIDEFRPAGQNANRHTARGLAELERSMNADGYVAALTVAADGEALDGSARLEKVAELFGDEVVVLEHDGTQPIVLVRTDVKNAQSPIAKRIAIRANRVAQLDLDWDPQELIETASQIDLGKLWTQEEWTRAISSVQPPPDEPQNMGSESRDSSENQEEGIVCPKCGYRIGH